MCMAWSTGSVRAPTVACPAFSSPTPPLWPINNSTGMPGSMQTVANAFVDNRIRRSHHHRRLFATQIGAGANPDAFFFPSHRHVVNPLVFTQAIASRADSLRSASRRNRRRRLSANRQSPPPLLFPDVSSYVVPNFIAESRKGVKDIQSALLDFIYMSSFSDCKICSSCI